MDTPSIGMSAGDKAYAASELARKREEEESKNHPVNVNGHKLTLGDLYSSHYDRKEMMTKLKLLDSKPSGDGESDMEPHEGTQSEEKQDVEEQLFGNGASRSGKAKSTKEVGTSDGEDDMEPYNGKK